MSENEKKPMFDVENSLLVTVEDKSTKNKYVEQECCTSMNILLTNEGDIETTFLGAHSGEVLKLLEKAMRLYFKQLNKELVLKEKKAKKQSIAYGKVKVKKSKSGNADFDVNTNDYNSATPISAESVINKTKDKEGAAPTSKEFFKSAIDSMNSKEDK